MARRRDVLRWGAGAAAGAASALAGGLTGGNGAAAAAVTPLPRRPGRVPGGSPAEAGAWQQLRRSRSPAAGLYRPGSDGFGWLAAPDNLRYAHVLPAGIVACAAAGDVQAAVRWAAEHGVPLAPRSGGHNYAGYSTT
ncbi:hypothetical protein VR46_20385, partial [Streptomyces sp. NRRL S-444]